MPDSGSVLNKFATVLEKLLINSRLRRFKSVWWDQVESDPKTLIDSTILMDSSYLGVKRFFGLAEQAQYLPARSYYNRNSMGDFQDVY